MEIDLASTFSNIPVGVVLVADIRAYIHAKLDEFSHHGKLLNLWTNKMMRNNLEVKLEFKTLVEKKLNTWNDFPNFCYENKWIRIAMSQFHDEFLWLDQTYLITKELMRVITGLSDYRAIPIPKLSKNKDVVELIGETYDDRSPSINFVKNKVMKYLSMMIGKKLYFTNRDNSISATTINITYVTLELNKDFDLYEILKHQFLDKLA